MASKTINQWCESHGLSRSYYYVLKNRGEAPREMHVGRCRRISDEADAEWVRARESVSQTEAA